mgnify:FL=1|jgi:hypothetical protein|tara:strand:+ start:423 stop:653 length:231 start_codon:yes stop_codon:yes gene_type:complete
MNKVGSLESQLMDAFKEKEEKEVATTAADAQKLQDKEIASHAARIAKNHRQKFNGTWRKKNKDKRKTAKASRRKNR